MDLTWSAQDQEFREAARDWLNDNVPDQERPGEAASAAAFDRAWQRCLNEGGWAGIDWPQAYGGRGLSIIQQLIWYEEYARARGPSFGLRFVGVNHAGPTLVHVGSPEQKRLHLPAILNGEALWCQGFSEPGAGSDLAGLQTRGVVDGDDLIIDGQKIWTSGADQADYQELLVRTEPGSRGHRGLTWIICPMRQPGIEVRPILKMTGRAEFCAVFYTGVRIPLTHVVGSLHDGWTTAMTTLSFERGTAFVAEMSELERLAGELIAYAKARPLPGARHPAWRDDDVRRRLADMRAAVQGLRALNYANLSRYASGDRPGAESSVTKLLTTETARGLWDIALELTGVAGPADDEAARWRDSFLNSFALSIGGGTPEIQRDIIATRLLGLARMPRP